MTGEVRTEIIRRLRVVSESLYSIRTLVETGAPCSQVLRQLCAVQADLQALKIVILKCQVETSESIIQSDSCAENRLTELYRLFDLYSLMIQTT